MSIVLDGTLGITSPAEVTGPLTATSITGLTTPLSIAQGGTGATTNAGTGFALKGANSDITSLSALSTALSVAQGGTGVTTSTGSGNAVLSTSPTLVTPILGTPTSGTLTNCTFPTLNQNTTGSSGSTTGNAATVTTVTQANIAGAVTPSTSGNVLTSNGTAWTSATPASSAPTTAQVGTATAGLAAGALGSYAFLTYNSTSDISFGTNYAGSSLLSGSVGVNGTTAGNNYSSALQGSSQSGTWKCMGQGTGGYGVYKTVVFLRVA